MSATSTPRRVSDAIERIILLQRFTTMSGTFTKHIQGKILNEFSDHEQEVIVAEILKRHDALSGSAK